MKITRSLIDKLLILRAGKSLPSSALRGEWVEELLRDGVLISRSQGSRRTLIASAPEKLELALRGIDERLGGLERMRRLLTQDAEISRYEQASETGNSKLVSVRSCPGFPVNSYEPIPCRLNGQEMEVLPFEGSLLFVASWQCFSIPKDVVVVGIENMENFRLIRQQRALFSVLSANNCFLYLAILSLWICVRGCKPSQTVMYTLEISTLPESTSSSPSSAGTWATGLLFLYHQT